MEKQEAIKLTIEGNQVIEIPCIGELNNYQVFETTKFDYDLTLNEKTKLIIRMEVKPLTEHERNMVLFKIGRNKAH